MSKYGKPISFSALQRAENSSIGGITQQIRCSVSFSALQRAENSSMRRCASRLTAPAPVSVLFSEPKIPQCCCAAPQTPRARRFSALQRAENSSIQYERRSAVDSRRVSVLFSEPKIPQYVQSAPYPGIHVAGFSALQRAENSSMEVRIWHTLELLPFQCSSASRKFLNACRNSSFCAASSVSVLFSEPKIPQFRLRRTSRPPAGGFSALQRAENSSIVYVFPSLAIAAEAVSVLFSEPKIPQ